jgi:HK97 family phage prohead protease/HK97 family phage major capsid protein
MPIKPNKDESQSDWMHRCVSEMMGDGKREQDQAVAACMSMWRSREKQVEPDDGESFEDFMDRCEEELDSDECRVIWSENRGGDAVLHKTHAETVNGMQFVLSDETPDRMDDIIRSDGWDLENFKKNPIALFNHNPNFVIGKWSDLRVDKQNKQLRGNLVLAPAGTSPRIDEIRKLIEADILKAVSVGFRPVKRQSRKEDDQFGIGGSIFTKSELVETSLVAVPANPNALAIAKSLGVSPATIDLVFAGQGATGLTVKRGLIGGQAGKLTIRKGGAAMSLAQRVTEAQTRLVALRDQLKAHLEDVDDSNVTDEQLEVTQELNAKIAQEEKGLTALQEAERHLAESSEDDGGKGRGLVVHSQRAEIRPNGGSRPFNLKGARKEVNIIDLLARSGAIMMVAHQQRKPIEEIRKMVYPDDEPTRAMLEWTMKAASAPAMTTVTGWAQELVQTLFASFMSTLMPKSVFPRLSAKGLSLTFGRNGRISVPTRALTPSIAGSFVGEGQPIPVRQGAFTAQVLTPKKMAVITTWTREIDEASVPAIEGLLRAAIQEDTAVSLDTVLLDANAATLIRPAGILNGVTPLTATAGGGFTALVGDIKQISGALLTATKGNVRAPVWIMNPQQVMSAGLTPAPGVGAFPFQDQINNGNLQGWPIIDSGTVPLGTVIAMDAADFVSVGGEAPRFELSDQATLHMEDTAPADIVSGGGTPTTANPVKSMWQTDSIALRLIMPTNWAIRRPGVVSAVVGVTW